MENRLTLRNEILKNMERNSRIDLKELSVLLGLEEAVVANEVAEMEKEKVIALIEVRVTPQRNQGFDRIAERVYNYPEVHAVYLISGGYDLLVTLEGKTLKEVSRFVSEKLAPIDSVISTATYFILKKYKDFGTIMVPKTESERMVVTP